MRLCLACRMTREKDPSLCLAPLPRVSGNACGNGSCLIRSDTFSGDCTLIHYQQDIWVELGMPTFPHDFICSMDLLEFEASVNKALRGEDVRQPRQVVEFARNFLARFAQADRLINVECCIK
ncbi:hypothetical protein LIER_24661 [Lithospermum erythrorhizon]|uniref:Uncharacterized protein n=1 Tax=Lithospermum erythrorhizon TaxID=34254 RepID=A0AAV3R5N9_LITER